METLIIIGLALIVAYLLIRFVFNMAKFALRLTLILALGLIALHFFSPKTIDDVIGKERHAKAVQTIKDVSVQAIDTIKEVSKEKFDSIANN